MEGNGNQRRYSRMDAVLPATLNGGGGSTALQTLNVSRNGVFLRSARPLPERHLIKLNFVLPGGRRIDVVGMVARAYHRADEHPLGTGMGVNFFVMSKEDRREWDRFCLELERKPHFRESVERTGVGPAPTAREPAPPRAATPPPAAAARPEQEVDLEDDSLAALPRADAAPLVGLDDLDELDAGDEVEIPLVQRSAQFGDDLDDLDVSFISDDIEVTVMLDEVEDGSAEASLRISDEVSLDPGSPHTHTALGRVLLEQMEDAPSAAQALQRALECDPDYLEAHLLLRLAYALMGQRERALEHLRIARRLQAAADARTAP